MKECQFCGAQNRDNAKFCIGCGGAVDEFLDVQETYSRKASEILKTGTLLKERFQVQDLMFVGGMGYIYLGYDVFMKNSVAIKEMIDHFTDPEERINAIERFKREANLLCTLKHPAIPKFLDYFVDNNRYYLVMEFIDGQDLRKVLKSRGENKPLPMEDVVKWALEICDVLEYLHAQQPPIVYRDLKPSNIIVTPNGEVKLVDFGIARLFIAKVKVTMVGTQGYAPPEQYRGEAEPRSDVYSLGATIHHLLSGKDPQYEAPFHFVPLRKLNPEIPQTLEFLIEKALRLVPEDRFQTAKQFKRALADLITEDDKFVNLISEIQAIESELSALKQKKYQILDRDGAPSPQKEKSHSQKASEVARSLARGYAWTQFRGNDYRNGLSYATTTLQGRLKWRYQTNSKIIASPIVDDEGNVYFGVQDGTFYSLSVDGNLRWKFKAKDVISGSAVLDEKGNIYFCSEDGNVFGIDVEGMERWRYNIQGSINSSPLFLNDQIYVASHEGWLYCFSRIGEKQWQFNIDNSIVSSPAADADGNIYLGCQNGSLISVNSEGGQRWSQKLPKTIVSTPATTEDGTIFVGCDDGFLYAYGDRGNLFWKFKTKGPIKSSPAVSRDGIIYIGSNDKFFYAVDRDGREKWRYDAEDTLVASPAISDEGTIYVPAEGGFLIALHANGKSRWWFDVHGTLHSSPAIGPKGMIYVGSTDGYLYAIH